MAINCIAFDATNILPSLAVRESVVISVTFISKVPITCLTRIFRTTHSHSKCIAPFLQ